MCTEAGTCIEKDEYGDKGCLMFTVWFYRAMRESNQLTQVEKEKGRERETEGEREGEGKRGVRLRLPHVTPKTPATSCCNRQSSNTTESSRSHKKSNMEKSDSAEKISTINTHPSRAIRRLQQQTRGDTRYIERNDKKTMGSVAINSCRWSHHSGLGRPI